MLKRVGCFVVTVLTLVGVQAGERLCGVKPANEVIVDFKTKTAKVQSAGKATVAGGAKVSVTFASKESGVTLSPTKGVWNVHKQVAIAIDIKNTGKGPVTLQGMLNDNKVNKGFLHLPAGTADTMLIYLLRKRENSDYPFADMFVGMSGMPGGFMARWKAADHKAVNSIAVLDFDGVSVGQSIVIRGVRAIGQYGKLTVPKDTYFPFVDEFGQFKHETWPGKVKSIGDLQSRIAVEEADLKKHPGPGDRSKFGGWTKGPKLKATGHFRTEKYKGKWWLVDPEGYLFWSHGITGVHFRSSTRIGERKHYFESIPQAFVAKNMIDFSRANLSVKYGKDWEAKSRLRSHQRLKSWGMNTLAAWSDGTICALKRTPYTVAINYAGYNKDKHVALLKTPDAFRALLRKRLEKEKGATAVDPWCIGYFVDNEIRWKRGMDAELYYKTVREEVKRAAPNKLYLGSRNHGGTPYGSRTEVAVAASKYCDVLSINRYRLSPSDLRMVKGADLAIIIGEFHFGALDRGMVHAGLRCASSQKQRAYTYEHYVTQALKHPHIVGTHWFCFREQAITGRGDGENYQVGFVDICDTPYHELVDAARRMGKRMYQYRSNSK